MHWRTKVFIGLLTLLTVIVGYLKFTYTPPAPEELAQLPATPTPAPEDSLTATDVTRMLAVPYTVDATDPASESAQLEFIQKHKPGMVVLFGSRIASSSAKLAVQQIKLAYAGAGYEPIIAVDHEGGTVQRLSGTGFTKLPSWQVLCHQDRQERLDTLIQSAQELQAVGVNMVFAPVLDLGTSASPLGTRICSNDATLTASAATDFVNAFLRSNITSVVKHYPGIGTTTRDLHDSPDVIEGTAEQSLFNAVLSSTQNIGVMSAHVLVEEVAEDKPCSLSLDCLYALGIDHPQALILADALEMSAARFDTENPTQERRLPDVATDAVMAGNHVLIFGPTTTQSELEAVVERLKTEYTEHVDVRSSMQAAIIKIEKAAARYAQESETSGN